MNTVSPSRMYACAIPTHENSAAVAGTNGLNRLTTVAVSVKATLQQVPCADHGRMMPHPAEATEKVSAGRPERPAIPDPHDIFIEACVTARERGLTRAECKMLLRDTFNAPWSSRD